jgi:hypothetical protein
VLRALLDSNAIDPVADNMGAFDVLQKAVIDGDLELLFTHINIDEIVAVPDVDRRGQLLVLMIALGKLIDTGVFVLDYSRLDFAA